MKSRSNRRNFIQYILCLACIFLLTGLLSAKVRAEDTATPEDTMPPEGGGYAATGQLENTMYTSQVYDESNGLPASEANFILGASDGYIWVGAYSGIMRFDGNNFTRLEASDGLANGRGLFEDSLGRIWVGTNDNGVVVIDGEKRTHLTYKDGLPSSSIRIFAEDADGDVFIGTTAGVCFADRELKIQQVHNERLKEERVLKLESDQEGRIYGQTKSGLIFLIENRIVTKIYSSEELGVEKITTILADPNASGKLYMGTEGSSVYYGDFGADVFKLKKIDVNPLVGVHWISFDCNRIWIASVNQAGYLDEKQRFVLLDDLSFDSGIEMMTSDYQGNMWFASSTQGIMKIVTNHFTDVMQQAGFSDVVVNAACLWKNRLFIGTDHGLNIIDNDGRPLENKLTEAIGDTRVRCLAKGYANDLWVGTYTNNKGLLHIDSNWNITVFNTAGGMPDNEIRDITVQPDGLVLAATNGGLAVIGNGTIRRTVGAEEGARNPVFLCVEQGKGGIIYAGTDGDGIYAIDNTGIRRIGRDEGLTSDVISKIKRDKERDVYWIVTSNSIEYLKDGQIRQVTTFPSSNNYDLFFDDSDHMWIVSSYGIYKVHVEDMLRDTVSDYVLYTQNNGLTSLPTAQGSSVLDEDGHLYIPVRNGLCSVDINHFSKEKVPIRAVVSSVYCGDDLILPDQGGAITIPATKGRIRITAAVLDYSLLNPKVSVYMEGKESEGITSLRSDLSPVEYTNLAYGNYKLHIRVMDDDGKTVLADEVFRITKKPQVLEMPVVRFAVFLLVVLAVALIVWRVMTNTVVRRQHEQIRQVKEEARMATAAKSRFLANMSHEIRTPINTIMGMNEMTLREDTAGVPAPYVKSIKSYASDIKNASRSLLAMVDDLLDISRLESGKMELHEEEYDTAELLRGIISIIRAQGLEKDLAFDVVIDETLPKRLYGDQGKLRQILMNLLTNSVKYTQKGGFSLAAYVDGREDDICSLKFVVKDTGGGIKQEDLEKLYTAYDRLDEQQSSDSRRTELGLDISHRFAGYLGGDLACESVFGKGTQFTLTVKQKIADRTPIGVFKERQESETESSYVPLFVAPDADVLVVDDNPMNLNVIKGLLKSTRVFVTTALSGEDCLEKMKDTRFDVVLLDHMMPGMDGVETLQHIREKDPDLVVYALSANMSLGEEFYIQKGFNGCLTKPIDGRKLEQVIMKHLPEEMMETAGAAGTKVQ